VLNGRTILDGAADVVDVEVVPNTDLVLMSFKKRNVGGRGGGSRRSIFFVRQKRALSAEWAQV
jgi:hypothetical protein